MKLAGLLITSISSGLCWIIALIVVFLLSFGMVVIQDDELNPEILE